VSTYPASYTQHSRAGLSAPQRDRQAGQAGPAASQAVAPTEERTPQAQAGLEAVCACVVGTRSGTRHRYFAQAAGYLVALHPAFAGIGVEGGEKGGYRRDLVWSCAIQTVAVVVAVSAAFFVAFFVAVPESSSICLSFPFPSGSCLWEVVPGSTRVVVVWRNWLVQSPMTRHDWSWVARLGYDQNQVAGL